MLELGTKAPPFRLPSSEGGDVSLADHAGSFVVLYFYPRDNTPGCTIEAQEFRDLHGELARAGAVVLGVSGDSLASHGKFRDKLGLPFGLLSDTDHAMMTAYGAWGHKVLYGKPMTGVIRSTVLIDRQGKIARHWPKVSVKGHARAVLDAVRELGGSAGAKKASAPTKAPAKKPAAPAKKPAAPAKKPAAPAKKPAAPAKKPAKKPAAPAKKPAAPAKKPAKKPAPKPAKAQKPVGRK